MHAPELQKKVTAETPLGRVDEPRVVTGVITMLRAPETGGMTGQRIEVTAGCHRSHARRPAEWARCPMTSEAASLTLKTSGRLDVLVNNAGMATSADREAAQRPRSSLAPSMRPRSANTSVARAMACCTETKPT